MSPSSLAQPVVGRAMLRLYNQWCGTHRYTNSNSEYDELGQVGWTQEQVGWYGLK